jgi:hypothetical protein
VSLVTVCRLAYRLELGRISGSAAIRPVPGALCLYGIDESSVVPEGEVDCALLLFSNGGLFHLSGYTVLQNNRHSSAEKSHVNPQKAIM